MAAAPSWSPRSRSRGPTSICLSPWGSGSNGGGSAALNHSCTTAPGYASHQLCLIFAGHAGPSIAAGASEGMGYRISAIFSQDREPLHFFVVIFFWLYTWEG